MTIFSANIKLVNWEQYFNALYRSRVTHVVEEYNMQTKMPPFDMLNPESSDSTYERRAFKVDKLENPSEEMKKFLIEFLESEGISNKQYNLNLQESIECAVIESMENFADIDRCVIVKLGNGDYLVASLDRNDIVVKLLDPIQTGLVINRPHTFVRFKVKEES